VLDYRVWYDQGTNNFVILASNVPTKSFLLTAGVVSGTYYKFKVEARNVIGYSALSAEISILAATVPPAVTNVVTQAMDNNTVKISWLRPSSNY
jgi:hypothetical protein